MELWRDMTAMITNPAPFERRLRLFVAREFASRGYYLDAEGFYHQITLDRLNVDELSLLANVALAAGNQHQAVSRFERLLHMQPDSRQAQDGLLAAKSLKSGIWQRFKSLTKRKGCSDRTR